MKNLVLNFKHLLLFCFLTMAELKIGASLRNYKGALPQKR